MCMAYSSAPMTAARFSRRHQGGWCRYRRLPGAMFLLGYFEDGTPVMGLPGCVMYAGATIFDLVLPFVAADVPVTRAQIVALGEGGLCLGCQPCHWPNCPFGR